MARKTIEWGKDNWNGDAVNVFLEDDGTYTFWRQGEGDKKGLTKDEAMKLYKSAVAGPRYNSRACNSSNPVVRKAMNACGTAKNSAFTDFGFFKDYKTFAETELSSLLTKFGEFEAELKKQAAVSKRGTNKRSEQEYIDACLGKCLSALKEARDRIQRQKQNVMQ